MKNKKVEFPNELYVMRGSDANDSDYYIADNDVDGYDDGVDVAVYQLVNIGKVKKTTTVEFREQ